jgi:hypothetical protein
MANPQQPELRRSEEIMRPRPDLGPDPQDVGDDIGGPVPPENRPGHQPEQVQDKPPGDRFAEAMGIPSDRDEDGGRATKKAAAKKAAAKKAAAKKGGGKKAAAKKAVAKKAVAGGGAKKAGVKKAATSIAPQAPAAEAPPRVEQPATRDAPAARSGGRVPAAKAQTATASGRPSTTGAGTGPRPKAPGAGETVSMGAAGATSRATSGQGGPEDPKTAAERHHHTLPDEQLPHDRGIVTPTGTPVTVKVLTLPLRYWAFVLRTSGGAVMAYGRFVRRTTEKFIPGRR